MPIVEPKIALDLESELTSALTDALGGPDAPDSAAADHAKLAKAIAGAVAKVIANLLLTEVQVAPGIPTAGSPAAQVTVGPGVLL